MSEVKLTGQRGPEVAEAATNPSQAPFQKHSLGDCVIDMPSAEAISFRCVIPCSALRRRALAFVVLRCFALRRGAGSDVNAAINLRLSVTAASRETVGAACLECESTFSVSTERHHHHAGRGNCIRRSLPLLGLCLKT